MAAADRHGFERLNDACLEVNGYPLVMIHQQSELTRAIEKLNAN
jgi:hypothetical protein